MSSGPTSCSSQTCVSVALLSHNTVSCYTGSLLPNSLRSDSWKGKWIGLEKCCTEFIYINANASKNEEQLNLQNTKLIYYTHAQRIIQ